MAWRDPYSKTGSRSSSYNVPENSTGYNKWFYDTIYSGANAIGRGIYDVTGYDPLGGSSYDYYGKNIKRQYATDLNGAGQAQYTAAQQQIAEKYKQARINSLQEAQARGLQSSGFAQSQSNAWTEKQINEEAQIYADLLQQEQATLDTFYVQDKQLAYNLAIRERQETLARQQMFQDYLLTFVDLAAEIGKVAGIGAAI